jgi:hypothetical protein
MRALRIILNIPLFLILLVVYNILEFSAVGPEGASVLQTPLFRFPLMSGSTVTIDVSGLLIIIGLHAIYFEILKSVRSSVSTIISHTLSLIVFIVFLVEFLMVPQAGTPSFLILTFMSLLVVIAGFTVSISSARRDFMVER